MGTWLSPLSLLCQLLSLCCTSKASTPLIRPKLPESVFTSCPLYFPPSHHLISELLSLFIMPKGRALKSPPCQGKMQTDVNLHVLQFHRRSLVVEEEFPSQTECGGKGEGEERSCRRLPRWVWFSPWVKPGIPCARASRCASQCG